MPIVQCPHCGSGVGAGKTKCPICHGEMVAPATSEELDSVGVAPRSDVPILAPAETPVINAAPAFTLPPTPPQPSSLAAQPPPTASSPPPHRTQAFAAPLGSVAPQPLTGRTPGALEPTAAFSAPPVGVPGAVVRVSLTGEVIPSTQMPHQVPSAPATGYGAPPPPVIVRPASGGTVPPRSQGPQLVTVGRAPEARRRGLSSGAKVMLGVTGACVMLAAMGVIAIATLMHRKTIPPTVNAEKFMHATQAGDWHTVYTLVYRNYATQMVIDAFGGEEEYNKSMANVAHDATLSEYKVGAAVTTAAGADVTVHERMVPLTGEQMGTPQDIDEVLHMVQRGGSWLVTPRVISARAQQALVLTNRDFLKLLSHSPLSAPATGAPGAPAPNMPAPGTGGLGTGTQQPLIMPGTGAPGAGAGSR